MLRESISYWDKLLSQILFYIEIYCLTYESNIYFLSYKVTVSWLYLIFNITSNKEKQCYFLQLKANVHVLKIIYVFKTLTN